MASLPFTKGLTLDVGFPLKVYECLIPIAMILAWRKAKNGCRPPKDSWPLIAFSALALISLIVNVGVGNRPIGPAPFPIRFGPVGDGYAKYVYALFAMMSYSFFVSQLKEKWTFLAKAWLVGAVVSSGISLHFSLASFFGTPLLPIPGLDRHQTILIEGYHVIRSGTFHEGNFAALYFVLSAALALHTRRPWVAVFISLACLSTYSSAGVVLLAVVWGGVIVLRGRSQCTNDIWALLSLISVLGLLQWQIGYATEIAFNKLTRDKNITLPFVERVRSMVGNSRRGGNPVPRDAGSLGVRLMAMKTSAQLFSTSPVLGIGLAQYGYHYWSTATHPPGFERPQEKPIPNNVYLEILVETGLAGFASMAIFAWGFVRKVWRVHRLSFVTLGLAAMAIGLNAYPTFTVLFLWVYLALAMGSPPSLSTSRTA